MHNPYGTYIGDLAVEALKLEASATPKPGLVDRANNGAHRDMDYPLFLKSAEALRECFRLCGEAGTDGQKLRAIGLAGEKSMYEATNHVNTHKGLIFSMGTLCGALGYLMEQGAPFGEPQVKALWGATASGLLQQADTGMTHGRQVYESAGIGGVRKEAAAGYPAVFETGLPALRAALAEGCSFEKSMIRALLALMCVVEDSNVVYRGGEEGLAIIQKQAARILQERDLSMVETLDQICIEKNLSPGGSADLLALTTMLYLFFEEKERNEGK